MIVIRKAERYDGDQLQMYDFLWEYEAIVSNLLDWDPIDIWRFYNQRACVENHIKEAKQGFSIHRIPTGSFKVNELDLLLKVIAYNVFERFKADCCEPVDRRHTITRFRQEFFSRCRRNRQSQSASNFENRRKLQQTTRLETYGDPGGTNHVRSTKK